MSEFPESQSMYERASKSTPQGTHSTSRKDTPHPIYFAHGKGPHVWDVDGSQYIDCILGNGALVFGHRSPLLEDAVRVGWDTGLESGLETPLSVEVAELFLRLVPTAEQVRFSTTGTEAVMHALHVARAATRKPDIAKVEAAYHGWYDFTYVSTWPDLGRAGTREAPETLPGAAGLHPAACESTVVLPFNDAEAATRLLEENQHRLAALIVEPVLIDVGFIPPEPGFLETLRVVTDRLGIVLIFDEMLTGFRLAVGGAQDRYGIQPDLSTWGKALSGGSVLSALSGRKDLMELTGSTVGFVGTFNGHQWSLATAHSSLNALEDGTLIDQLHWGTEFLAERFSAAAKRLGVSAVFQGGGGHFQIYFGEGPIKDYRSAAACDAEQYARFRRSMLKSGVLFAPGYTGHSAISTAHDESILHEIADCMEAALENVAI
jgi:glutamate-1-semialdehyde 2,1-aminomutase